MFETCSLMMTGTASFKDQFCLSPANRTNDLHLVAGIEPVFGMLAGRNDFTIDLDRDAFALQGHCTDEIRYA